MPDPSPLRPRLSVLLLSLVAVLSSAACSGEASSGQPADASSISAQRERVAFVTNCAVEFWAVAEAGVQAAAAAEGVDVLIRMPPTGTVEEQQRMLQDCVSAGVQGIAVSPKNPDDMTGLLDDLASRCLLITHDSDAPKSDRLCFIGVDNYVAGRLCGELIREACPDGGAVVLLIGTMDQDNSRRRRQGVIDELFGRTPDATRFDPLDGPLREGSWEIRATYTDNIDPQKAKTIAQDALTRWSDLACMVGLFEHEAPQILDAVRSAGRLGEVAIVSFDENQRTLQGIAEGHIHGTVVQNPYEYGYQSVKLLAELLRASDDAARQRLLPADGMRVVPARQIRKADVDAFRRDLDQKLGR